MFLNNYKTTEYSVVTIYDDGSKTYSFGTTDKSLADDYEKRMKSGFSGTSVYGKVKEVFMVERITSVNERIVK